MKIVSLLASPRGEKGNTGRLLEIVLEGARRKGAAVETVVLPGGTVLPCRACDTCHRKGFCPQKDGFEGIKARITAADGVVLASPNYIFSVSAQMKAFMDRCCGAIHCMAFEGKYGASVVTSGGGDEEPVAGYMNHFLMTTGIRPVGSVWATMGEIGGEDFPEAIKSRALGLGERLVEWWEKGTTTPEVERTIERFRERISRLILYRGDEWQYEREYWEKNRGLRTKPAT
ncbi:MAG: flavodoxin family protein [bacterium]